MRALGTMLLAALLSAGCARTQPSRFYSLRPTAEAPAEARAPAAAPVVHIGPVSVSPHLLRPYLAERTGGAEISYSEFDRWASGLDEEIALALERDLAAALAGTAVVVRDETTARRHFTIGLRVFRFEREGPDAVRVEASWRVVRVSTADMVASGRCDLTRAVESAGPAMAVEALSAALGDVVSRIARDVSAAIASGSDLQ